MKPTPHLDLAHKYWKDFLKKEDSAIDATCGNGHDSLVLAQILSLGHLFCYDIQEKAIQETKRRLQGLSTNISYFQKSHTDFSDTPTVKLIVYNLGYLPLSDKAITTMKETSLISVQSALQKVMPGGAVSITCYPGHEEGEREEKALLELLRSLPSHAYSVSYHQWLNRPKSPTLLWIIKNI